MKNNVSVTALITLSAALAGIVGTGIAYQSIGSRNDKRKYQEPGVLVDVEGHRLHLYCKGEGEVTVIMDAGLAQASLVWSRVQSEVATFARACVYDRAGYAWSDANPIPRTNEQIAKELFSLLHKADIRGPYILVGHSFSGLTMRLFAAQHPDDVIGIVLVDALGDELFTKSPQVYRRYFTLLKKRLRSLSLITGLGLLRLLIQLRQAQRILPGFITAQPEEMQPLLLAGYLNTKNFSATIAEIAQVERNEERMHYARPIRNIPLAVLTHGLPTMFAQLSKQDAEQAESIWQQQQAKMAKLSSKGRLVVAEQSSHDIHIDQPEAVLEAIQWVMKESLRPKRM